MDAEVPDKETAVKLRGAVIVPLVIRDILEQGGVLINFGGMEDRRHKYLQQMTLNL